MKKTSYYKTYGKFLFSLILIGQISFAFFSKTYTKAHFENRIFFTTGIVFDGSDLHKLNEAAHYFGQTMIGWTKFPNFKKQLLESIDLPLDTGINMHVQERQNMIFTLSTHSPIKFDQLKKTKSYLEGKIDEYNKNTNTQFVMTNLDYEQSKIEKNYLFGSVMTLILSIALAIALFFIREMFFPPKLKF